ncbi:DegT/DnrJ/EryC1/StrS family aminotransferase [Sphingomonas hengshuiensis]|uniref:DegT/DnrJ/EryC1/StrS family aminotransferase n=1 Tax=Sphingomonas hengshuiensis TaxID=1609977 RepID=UPI000A536919|nr:DegT/DnrJ/EryC1/StrS family aminotransferase [Sphingomonas hengshuiensis]
MAELPLIAARPPRLSEMADALAAIETSGIYTNGGPVVRRFEAAIVERLYGGAGDCLAVPSATMGLMLAIRHAREGRSGDLALMPAFTFAATAHAALWAGLTPVLVDSNPDDWAACAAAEDAALRLHGERVAVIVPYDSFGTGIDLDRYARISGEHGAGIVVDAAASLGNIDAAGTGFGGRARFATVFSMHATKPFGTAEGGLVYSADAVQIAEMRRMSNYGFDGGRAAMGPGMNAKLPEVLGLLALARLEAIEGVAAHRIALAARYREGLGDAVTAQRVQGARAIPQFHSVLLPADLAPRRAAIMADLAAQGIGSGHYFSPHLGQQPYFQRCCIAGPTPVADAIGARMLSLPVTDAMTLADVDTVAGALLDACARARRAVPAQVRTPQVHATLLVGGGPAGIAMLLSASKQGRLADLAAGLVVVERGVSLGGGQLARYAITSDSTAETFLTAARDNPHPEIAALTEHPSGQEIARHIGRLGVPLARTGAFLEALGDRVGAVVAENGGSLLTGHAVVEARRTPAGLWQARIRDCATGAERTLLARNLVLATGGYQCPDEVASAQVAGMPLGARVGERLVPSDAFLRIGGVDALRARLAPALPRGSRSSARRPARWRLRRCCSNRTFRWARRR